MNLSTTSPGAAPAAPAWLRELTTARGRYEEDLGWPVSLDVGTRCLSLVAGRFLDALMMPAALAARAQAELAVMMLAGPVAVTGPGGGRWTFLTAPPAPDRRHVPHDLHVAGVHSAPYGSPIVLPPHLDTADRDQTPWVDPPAASRALPTWPAVVGAARRVLARHPS